MCFLKRSRKCSLQNERTKKKKIWDPVNKGPNREARINSQDDVRNSESNSWATVLEGIQSAMEKTRELQEE